MIEYHVRKHLSDFINSWCEELGSRTDSSVVDAIKDNCFIAGGAIPSLLNDETPSDYDVYVDSESALKQLVNYYLDKYNDINDTYFRLSIDSDEARIKKNLTSRNSPFVFADKGKSDVNEYNPIALTDNAITISRKSKPPIQLIVRFYGDPDEVVDNFDFAHTKNYYYQGQIDWDKKAMKALLGKDLIYTGSDYPVCALIRTRKFIKRGYAVGGGDYLKMACEVSNLDLSNPEVLREQLIGVDVFYFMELLSEIEGEDEVSSSDVADLIDKLNEEGIL